MDDPIEISEYLLSAAPSAGVRARTPFVERVLFSILLALFIAVPLVWSTASRDSFLLPKAILLTTLSLAALCAWLAGLVATGTARIRRSPLYPVIALFALSLAPGCVRTANPWLTLDALAWYGTGILALLLASSFSLTAPRARLIAGALIIVATVEAAYGICQFFGWEPVFHARVWMRSKVFGTFGNPNFLSAFLAACLPMALIASLGPGSVALRVAAAFSCAVIATGILLSGTRGSMLAAVVSSGGVLAYGFARRRALGWPARGPWALAGALLLAAGVVLAVARGGAGAFKLSSRFSSSSDLAGLSIGKRVLYWKSSWEMIRAHPLTGWGPGTYRLHFLDAQATVLARPENASHLPFPGVTLNAHNDYLELWAESGTPALLLFLALIAVVIARGLRGAARGEGSWFILGLLGGFVSLAIVSLVCFPLHRPGATLLFWSFAGMIAASPEDGERGWLTFRAPRAVSALLLAASCAALCLATRHSLVRLRAEALFKFAYDASDRGRWYDAVVLYRKGLALRPRDGESRINLGIALFRTRQWDAAIAEIGEAFHEVRDFNGHRTIADAYTEKGDMARAVAEYQRVLTLIPGDGKAMNNLGVCLSRQGKDANAVALWERGAAMEPPSPDCLTSLAYYHLGKGDLARAKQYATRSLDRQKWGNSAAQARLILKRTPTPIPPTPTPKRTPVPPTATPCMRTPTPRSSPPSSPSVSPGMAVPTGTP